MNINEIRAKSESILQKYDVKYAGVFGSVARGEDRPDSDIDMLVEFNVTPGLFKFIGLENELAGVLNKKVDLATQRSLHRLIKVGVMRDLKIFYEQK